MPQQQNREKKIRRRTGGGQRKADLSAKHEKAAAITVEKAQLCGIPPRNEVDSDAISIHRGLSSSSDSHFSKISIWGYFRLQRTACQITQKWPTFH